MSLLRLSCRRGAVPPCQQALASVSRCTRQRRHYSNESRDQQQKKASGQSLPIAVAASLVVGYAAYGLLHTEGITAKSINTTVLKEDTLPPQEYADVSQMEKALAEIRSSIPDHDTIISTDPDDLHAHGYSEWSSVNCERLPVAVAYPRDTQDVSTIARICSKWRVPMIPYSGGSSIEGHIGAPFGGISIDFAFMDKIMEYRPEDMDITVQPGLCWTDLNHEIAKTSSLFFPIDPAPSAKIGGMVATNCSGTNAVRYGTMRDWVVNLTIVLADGSVIKTRRRPRKSSAGYFLNGLFVGSEGTLGIVTEATLKLAVIPEQQSVAVVTFPTLREAVEAATAVVRKGVPVAAVELMDDVQMRIVNEGGETGRKWAEKPTLFFKFSGSQAGVDDNIKTVQGVIQPFKPSVFEWAKDRREQEILWSARKQSLWSLLALRGEGEVLWNTDVAVPLSRLADIIEKSSADITRLGLKATIKGHVGDGNFHENITYNPSNEEEAKKVKEAVKNMVKNALEMEGTCTGEHGIGLGKKAALAQEVGAETILVMKLLKATLDPAWILNPGKVL
ncbi:hypothetical protein CC79DRAFT_1393282 [Sarocladium strictum]